MQPSFNLVLVFATGATIGLAGLLIAGFLCFAALLPRGHPAADRLRYLASQIPLLALAALVVVPAIALAVVIAFFVVF
jgi:hypothetical protein